MEGSVLYAGLSPSICTITAVLALVIYVFLDEHCRDSSSNRIPKGPWGLPILGSFPFLTKYPELTLDYWARTYGALYSIWLGNQLFVIVSDPKIAKDLMVTHGKVFSSRKQSYIKSQTVFAGRGITTTPYNGRWRVRKHRRIANTWLNQRAVDSYSSILDRESKSLIKALLDESQAGTLPINPQPHAGRCILNGMTTISFGFRFNSIDHPFVRRALKINREYMNCTAPMSNLVDFIPVLQALPSSLYRRGKKLHHELVETYGGLLHEIDQKMQQGEEVPDCLAKTIVEVREKEGLDNLDMAMLASAFMIGGVETTFAILQWFCALIPAYPEIQIKAQAELERVVGRERLPTIEDQDNLPYCRAIIKEVERLYNPLWLGTPHSTSEDFVYRGQLIPKDTVVVLNTWTLHHDPARYCSPEEFKPERYINDSLSSAESANVTDPMQRDHWIFGVGRRICPGVLVAERELYLNISRMLWAFNMHELPKEPINLRKYDGLSGRSPAPFRIQLTPRDENVAKALEGVEV
ncbi:cytochrome P450 [Aspergillus sclerotioniger CBS 115572]|uniref:Cytochrome P450 n=1 Tax=Aspergillus sclerotioniger CBS 115572 TaxID=1450535 RepID=A0A317X6K5_9EURO|nr:cytochrome P450 [Aspergillus sclerotioniger CBS 115572]PWY94256.1 cytochrome P450 [Aspergillus sclerotioniger CBS 115572]